jgi:8-hydroxy-5-deazaflavin:NADPH oxidoreductase
MMKFGVLGTGMVGKALATKLLSLGHDVMMGGREADGANGKEWAAANGTHASYGDFAKSAKFGEMLIVATTGTTALDALKSAGNAIDGKVVIDVSNPLDFSKGMPPTLSVLNTDSLGEQLQRAFPKTPIVKTLNTMSNTVMVNPSIVPGDSDVFVSGNDAGAKAQVVKLLQSFGWKQPFDLGDITTARGTEMMLPVWLRLWGALGKPEFNFKIVR